MTDQLKNKTETLMKEALGSLGNELKKVRTEDYKDNKR